MTPPLGWNTARPGADLVGEGEQVELGARAGGGRGARPRRCARGRPQLVLGRPRGAVDALQLRVLLDAAPVGGRRPGQLEAVAQHPGARDVRAAAQVLPDDRLALAAGAPHVLVDAQPAEADLDRRAVGRAAGSPLRPMSSSLYGSSRSSARASSSVTSHGAEGLALLDDAPHHLLDRLEVLRGERGLDVEVVVEAVGDRRADAEPRLRVDLLHGLREHVRRRVPQHGQAVGLVDRHRLDDVAVGQRGARSRSSPSTRTTTTSRSLEQVTGRRLPRHRSLASGDGDGDLGGRRGLLVVSSVTRHEAAIPGSRGGPDGYDAVTASTDLRPARRVASPLTRHPSAGRAAEPAHEEPSAQPLHGGSGWPVASAREDGVCSPRGCWRSGS